MSIREVPRYRWSHFLEAFNRDHRGALCSLDVDSSVAGTETEAHAWPFEGLVLETGLGSAPRVQIFVGERLDRHLGHALIEPHHIWIEETEGEQRALHIDADEGAIHLRFRAPPPPEYIETYLP